MSYALLLTILIDTDQYDSAHQYAFKAVTNDRDKNYQIPRIAGDNSYNNLKNYKDAIFFYKTALKNVEVNVLEAECKMMLAKSYRKTGDLEEANAWYRSAISEVEEDQDSIGMINKQWNE